MFMSTYATAVLHGLHFDHVIHVKTTVALTYIRGGQMVKSFNITSKITYFCLKGYNESYKTGL